jgi:tellurite resistance protein TerC
MTLAKVKRIIVTVVGFTVLIIGIVLIVFPGPAFIVIPIGLAILATEYVWAKRLFEGIKRILKKKEKPSTEG